MRRREAAVRSESLTDSCRPAGGHFPQSTHVQEVGLDRADDAAVWNWARTNGFIIVSKDSDFHERSVFSGTPPKVVWLRRGNCTTHAVEQLMREHAEEVAKLLTDDAARFLILF